MADSTLTNTTLPPVTFAESLGDTAGRLGDALTIKNAHYTVDGSSKGAVVISPDYKNPTQVDVKSPEGVKLGALTVFNDGGYRFDPEILDHGKGDPVAFDLVVEFETADGGTETVSQAIEIVDEAPVAIDDVAPAVLGPGDRVGDSVFSGFGDKGTQDTFAGSSSSTNVTAVRVPGGDWVSPNDAGEFVLQTTEGTLTVLPDGAYDFVAAQNIADGVSSVVFEYEVGDADGVGPAESSIGNLTIMLDPARQDVAVGDRSPKQAFVISEEYQSTAASENYQVQFYTEDGEPIKTEDGNPILVDPKDGPLQDGQVARIALTDAATEQVAAIQYQNEDGALVKVETRVNGKNEFDEIDVWGKIDVDGVPTDTKLGSLKVYENGHWNFNPEVLQHKQTINDDGTTTATPIVASFEYKVRADSNADPSNWSNWIKQDIIIKDQVPDAADDVHDGVIDAGEKTVDGPHSVLGRYKDDGNGNLVDDTDYSGRDSGTNDLASPDYISEYGDALIDPGTATNKVIAVRPYGQTDWQYLDGRDGIGPEDTDPRSETINTDLGGKLTMNQNGSYRYTAPADKGGQDVIEYLIVDGDLSRSQAKLTLNVEPPATDPGDPNLLPDAFDDFNLVDEGKSVNGSVIVNDNEGDPNGVITSVEGTPIPTTGLEITGTYGKLVIQNNGSYTYTADPDAREGAKDQFTYTLTDDNGDTDQAVLTIDIDQVGVPGDGAVAKAQVDEAGLDINKDGADFKAGTVEGSKPTETTETVTGQIDFGGAAGSAVAGTFDGAFGTLQVNGDGSFVYTLTQNSTDHSTPNSTAVDGVNESFQVTVQDAYGNTGTATIEIDIVDDVPTARTDYDIVAPNSVTTGNVITGEETDTLVTSDSTTVNPGLAADTEGADATVVVEVNYTDSNGQPATAFVDRDAGSGLKMTSFETEQGSVVFYSDGSYEYTANSTGTGSGTGGSATTVASFGLPDGGSSGSMQTAWSGATLRSFDLATSITLDGKLNPEMQQGVVTFTGRGVGVSEDNEGLAAANQINHDPETGKTQGLVVALDTPGDRATFTVSNLYNTEEKGEVGVWQAFSSDGTLVGDGTFGSDNIDYNSDNVGTVSIAPGASFSYLVFSSTFYDDSDSNRDARENDSSDYFLRSLDVTADGEGPSEDVMTYVLEDADGDRSWADLIIKPSEEPQPENKVPIAKNDDLTVDEGAFVENLTVIGNDTGGDGALSIAKIGDVDIPDDGPLTVETSLGTLVIRQDGTYSYTAKPDAGGETDTFTYTLTDADGDTNTADLIITINDIPEPPALEVVHTVNPVFEATVQDGVYDPEGQIGVGDYLVDNEGVPLVNKKGERLTADDPEYDPGSPTVGGVDPANLTLAYDTEASIQFQSEGAGWKNTIGMYQWDAESGEIDTTSIKIIWQDASQVDNNTKPDGYTEDGEPTTDTDKDAGLVRDFWGAPQAFKQDLGNLEAGTTLGFFQIAKGADASGIWSKFGGLNEGTNDKPAVNDAVWEVVEDENGALSLTVKPPDGEPLTFSNKTWFSHHVDKTDEDPGNEVNSDGFQHVISGVSTNDDDGYLYIGFEDQSLGDRDFNDTVFRVDLGDANLAELTGRGYNPNVRVVDDEDDKIAKATVVFRNAGDGEGLTFDLDIARQMTGLKVRATFAGSGEAKDLDLSEQLPEEPIVKLEFDGDWADQDGDSSGAPTYLDLLDSVRVEIPSDSLPAIQDAYALGDNQRALEFTVEDQDGLKSETEVVPFNIELDVSDGTTVAKPDLTGQGDEPLVGSDADDTITAGNSGDQIFGGDGNDEISGGDGDDQIVTGLGNDQVNAGAGDDTIVANGGNNTIYGGEGDDTLIYVHDPDADNPTTTTFSGGAGWADTLQITQVGGSSVGAPGGDGWTVTFDNDDKSGWLDQSAGTLKDDSAGTIRFDGGTEIKFDGLEKIEWV